MRRLLALIVFLLCASAAHAQSATVTWGTTHQTMDGFGGQTWTCCNSLTDGQADLFFSPTTGIGLEYVRTANTAAGTYPDLVTLQKAVARGALVELGLQSPPASMKVSGSFTDGTGGIITADYGAYATYIVNQINLLASNGVPVAVLDVQNEPDIAMSSLGANLMSAAQFDTFVGTYLGPALASAGLHPKVMIGSASGWFSSDYVSTCLNDATCAQYVSIAAGHGYGTASGTPDGFTPQTGYCCNTASAAPGSTAGKEIWQSEINGGFTYNTPTAGLWQYDASMADGLVWARNIHDYLTVAGISGYQYWELADCCGGTNAGYTDASFNPSKRAYVIGQWSKAVRSGWVRMDATSNPTGSVYCTAFKAPTGGNFAIVCTNQSTSASVTFNLSGFSSVSSVTPVLTDATHNLATQSAIAVSGLSFTTTIPASSVITFTGAAGAVTPVTNLYISQSGAGGGTSCADTKSAAFFNDASNWGSSATIAPGTTVHLCGTFTGTAGGTMLVVQGSGTSGNHITLLGETGANFTAPYWRNGSDTHGGAINVNGQNYIDVLGGPACGFNVATLVTTTCNGTIQNSANGTGLANQQSSVGFDISNSTNIRVAYWNVINLYNRTGSGMDPHPVDPNSIMAFSLEGSSNNNITVDHNSLNNDSWTFEALQTSDNVTFGPGNDVFNACHGMAGLGAHWTVYGNHFHDWGNWTVNSSLCHGDGIHCYAGAGGITVVGLAYNNYFDGNVGSSMNQFIFPEGAGSANSCTVPGGTLYEFNNVMIANGTLPAFAGSIGNSTTGNAGDVIANNTLIAAGPNDGSIDLIFQDTSTAIAENNALSAGGFMIGGGGTLGAHFTTFDHNAYQNNTSFNTWDIGPSPNVDTSSFATWKAANCTGSGNTCDQNGLANLGSSTYFNLPSTCVSGSVSQSCAPLAGSPLIGAGANLTSLCTGVLVPLCSDIAGNPRPTSGAWAIGAFQSGSVPASPQGVIGGKVLMSGKISLQY